jgi:hemerythrin-like domain-containing protein
MLTATQILRQEHDAILKMLDVADCLADRLDTGAPVASQSLADLLEFLRTFADTCHHGKEEDLLFPALERKGMPRQMGPVGVMLMEHDQGRALIRLMAQSGDALAAGDTRAAKTWARAARDYTNLLRNHIMKENEILFVMAERMLSSDEQRELAQEFDKVELQKLGAGTYEHLHATMERLVAEASAPAGR